MVKKILGLLAASLAFIVMLYRGRLTEQEKKNAMDSAVRERENTAAATARADQQQRQITAQNELKQRHQTEAKTDADEIARHRRDHFNNEWD
ncbi:MAG TPA: hypothetical protein DEA26_00720 [Oceanospirillales bacterium]|nr:hypothetical protein [Oceanospirillaceae bacterium]HBS41171.1 hypothetical protein [Oceanospirillales bacterium]|tara:strand:+ start:2246 stop:2521 length:276 start_codon:yes stop_codon:yes gene_type:complete